ncbi:MAG: hypothetical protein HW378_2519 [Anaerolineales bacterium]|nr:hypothetical protein [Anaerolineales bacterium]
MKVYINYPDPHLTIHRNPECSSIQLHQVEGQRHIEVTMQRLREELSHFINNQYHFGQPPDNDLWLDITLSTPEQEVGLVYIIQAILSLSYTPFMHAPVKEHCSNI